MQNQQTQILNFAAGTVIFRQGEYEKVLYKILLGEVGIYSDYGAAKEICLSRLEKNQCFGEMSILEDCPRSATVVAETDVSLMAYPEQLMSTFIYQNPSFALELMQNLSKLLRNSTHELEKMHGMLLRITEEKKADRDIKEYVHRHTVYDLNGSARFSIKI